MKHMNFHKFILVLLCGALLFLPQKVTATAIATSNLAFSNLQIVPNSGSVELLDFWFLDTFAEAHNSLGEYDVDYDPDDDFDGNAKANAVVSFAAGHGEVSGPAPDLSVAGNASSNVNIPGCDQIYADALGRGGAFNLFMITGGTGTVDVEFSVDLSGNMSVFTDDCGLFADTEVIFGMELDGSAILSFQDYLHIGPSDSDARPISETLSTTLSLEFDSYYFLYMETDSESEAATVPAPSTGILLFSGLCALGFIRRKNVIGTSRTGLSTMGAFLIFLLIPLFLVVSSGPAQARYIGGGKPCACDCEETRGPDTQSFGGSSLSSTEGNLQERYNVTSLGSSAGATIDLNLTYNSFDADASWAKVDTVLGYGWTHSYNMFLFSQRGHMFRMDGNGRTSKYTRGPGGTFTPTKGYFETLVQNLDGTFTLTQKDGTIFNFALIPDTPFMVGGPVYRLTTVKDRNNNVVTLTYTNGNLTLITDTFGRSISLGYNSENKLTTITDPLGRTTTISYDSTGKKLLKISDPEGYSVQYDYNFMYQLIDKIDKNGRGFSYTYLNMKPVAIKDEGGNTVFRLTNPQNWATDRRALAFELLRKYIPSITSKIDGRGNLWKYEYNENGYITKVIAPDGATTTYTYDPVTLQVATQTDANGNTTIYEYDAMGNRTKVTDCQGNETFYTYEPVYNQVTSITNPNGHVTTYDYDASGNRIKETDPLGNTILWTYNAHGSILTETDKMGHVKIHEYDAFGNRTMTTDALGNVTIMSYDIVGNMLTRIDANGNATTFLYDGLDRLITETDALGNVTTYVYDGNGNRVQNTDCNGIITQYQYDLRDRLVKVIDALGHETIYAYDDNNNRISITDANGNTTTSAFDVQNRPISTTDALGNSIVMAYDGVGNKLTETDANGHSTAFEYDCLNRLIKQTDAIGCITQFEYDTVNGPGCLSCSGPTIGSSVITKQIDANGKVTYFKYDALNRRIKEIRKEGDTADIIDPSDAVTEYSYDSNDNRLSVKEPNGNITNYEYDPLNRLIKETNPAGDVTLTTYDPVGNIFTVTAPNGNLTTNTYDGNNRLTKVEDSIGLVAEFTYDCAGNRLIEKDGNSNLTSYTYDAVYRLTQVTDPMGEPTYYEYDSVGNQIKTIDRNGNITTQAYDAVNRRISATDAFSNTTQYEYDSVGNLLKIIDANGNPTRYEYDPLNRLVKETYADSVPNARTFTYDCVGNLLTRTDQKGQTTTYVYNDLYFLMQRGYPVSVDDNFTYDLSGRMLTAERGGWLVAFSYDGASRVTQTIQNGQTIDYTYNIPGRTRTITYPGGRMIMEQMDLRARLHQIDDAGSPPAIVQYAYDPGNRVTSRTYRNGVVADYTYNANNWVTDLVHSFGSTLIAGFSHDYDTEGNKLYEEKQHDPAKSEAYQYDSIYRLIDFKVGELVGSTVLVPSTQSQYNLDPLGNWNSRTTDGVTENRTHNVVNEITTINAVPISHDNNGNLDEDETYSYAYDEENRLISVMRNSDSQIMGQYQYDALSRRVVKLVNPAGTVTETRYFYDGARVIEEQDAFTVTEATYIYGNYIDEILTMDRGGDTYYYHQNSLFSIAAVTDSTANVVEQYRYDAYGCVTVTDGAGIPVSKNAWGTPRSAIDNPYMFTGRRLDEETGLYYYRARYYDCEKGRFLQRDPASYVDGINLYEYVKGNSLVFADPFGLDPITAGACALEAGKIAATVAIDAVKTTAGIDFRSDQQSKKGIRNKKCSKNATKCVSKARNANVWKLKLRAITGTSHKTIFKLDFEWNGCDVTGAVFNLGDGSFEGWRNTAVASAKAVDTDLWAVPKPDCECCAKAACVKFSLSWQVRGWFGQEWNSSGILWTCGNGTFGWSRKPKKGVYSESPDFGWGSRSGNIINP